MASYRAPARDTRFVIEELLDFSAVADAVSSVELDKELTSAVIEEAGRFAAEVLAPLNEIGDKVGAKLEGEEVTPAPGYKEAYEQFVESGWAGISGPVEFDGQAMPNILSFATQEFWHASNMAFALCPMLSQAAVEAIHHHGSPSQQAQYLKKLVTGEWTGTMDLTEPQAGSDLAALNLRAEPQGDHYRLKGQKIYITWGDHNMTDNVIHMVLGRTPTAPEGVKGISLFVVPKFVLNEDGSPGKRNDMKALSLEHKLGIHGSPTCVMGFGEKEGAIGYLVGEENRGLQYMFTMMNHARLNVGSEGLGIADRAYQQALAYAKDRVQGSVPGSKDRVTIINHPDVRRMLMLMKAQTEAMRALVLSTAEAMDLSTADQSGHFQRRVDLMVPVVKAWCTELAQEVCGTAIQVHGGMGFIEETGVAQHYRDARITTIYEGTTGIQALDFIGRKVLRDGGQALSELIADMEAILPELKQAADFTLHRNLEKALQALNNAAEYVFAANEKDPNIASAIAFNMLMLTGTVVGGWQMARSYLCAEEAIKTNPSEASFYSAKQVTAQFYAAHVLPRARAYADAVLAGNQSIIALPEDAF